MGGFDAFEKLKVPSNVRGNRPHLLIRQRHRRPERQPFLPR
jgi:hypothetical protein